MGRTMWYVQRWISTKFDSIDEHVSNFRAIVDDAKIKLTVYHRNKNALSKGDLIGRAYVSLRDLDDYDQVHNK